jgi:hypothetical protein
VGSWLSRGLVLGLALCAGLALWAGTVQSRAKQCLDGDLDGDKRARSRGITEQGCEITTESGATVVIQIDGPPFEVGVAAVLGFVVLGLVLVVVTIRSRRRREGRAFPVKAFLTGGVITYLVLGLLVAAATVPRQMWVCSDPNAPHGHTTHGGYADPPRDDCRAGVTVGEQVLHFLLVTSGWLPLGVVKSVS